MVAMNAQTYARDLEEVAPGGVLLYDSTWPRDRLLARADIEIIGVPLARMCNERFANARTRILMKNMAYVGVLAALLELDRAVIVELVKETFARKPALIESNQQAIDLGFDYARAHLECPLPQRVKALDKTAGHIMIDGNTAAALGCVVCRRDGRGLVPDHAVDVADGRVQVVLRALSQGSADRASASYCIVQAEDELAAIGIVLGATWNGARAFTPTSGPGLSLMSEFLGFAYFAELPAVLFDVQRVGPSTGMPTRTQQADLLAAAYASHGDTKHVLLFPRDPRECFELAVTAFDLADRLQTPVIVHVGSRHRHERLDVPRARLGPRLPARSRQGARRPSSSRRPRRFIATSTSTATASRSARCPACIRAARTSCAARATTSTAATPRTRRSTSKSSTGSRRSGRRPPSSCPSP